MEENKKVTPAKTGEIRSMRGLAKKVYEADNGCLKAIYAQENVHYYDKETGEYHTPDNGIAIDEEGRYYVNKKGGFQAGFSREEDNDELFVLQKDRYKVTMSLNRPSDVRGSGMGHELKTDRVYYRDVYEEADLEYTVNNSGIKENIIISKKANIYRYSFSIACENVFLKQGEDGIIRFSSIETGEEVFYIPQPYMYDACEERSYAVTQSVREHNGNYILTVTCDSEWINASERVLPVVVDPQLRLNTTNSVMTYSYNGTVYSNDTHYIGGVTTGSGAQCVENRAYFRVNMTYDVPLMYIRKVELKLKQRCSGITEGAKVRMGLYKVNGEIYAGGNPSVDSKLIDYELMHTHDTGNGSEYTFDITALAEEAYVSGNSNLNLAVKLTDSSDITRGMIEVYHATMVVTYENICFKSDVYRSHTHELGRLGTGSINVCKGDLIIESTDFAWSGNRMPVTIKHVFNSRFAGVMYTYSDEYGLKVADFSDMKVGRGYRLNVMQSIVYNSSDDKYVFNDGECNETYFSRSSILDRDPDTLVYYYIYTAGDNNEVRYDPVRRIITMSDRTYEFDTEGHLIKETDKYGNCNEIIYTAGKITAVVDGAGRAFDFAYTSDGYLASITAPDNTSICYTYTNGCLARVTYQDGSSVVINLATYKPVSITIKEASGNDRYRVSYTYDNAGRVISVTEHGAKNGSFVIGASSAFSYDIAARRTTVTTTLPKDECEGETQDTVISTVYTYDDDCKITGEYAYTTDTDNMSVSGEAGINPYMGDKGMSYIKYSENLIRNPQLNSLAYWETKEGTCGTVSVSEVLGGAYLGNHHITIKDSGDNVCEGGIKQSVYIGDTAAHTFSAYIKVEKLFTGNTPGVYLRVTDTSGNILSESEYLKKATSDYIRLATTFSNYSGTVIVSVLINGKGIAYVNGAQVEKGEYAGEYNMLDNGSFEYNASGWTLVGRPGPSVVSGQAYNRGASLELDADFNIIERAYQTVAVKSYRDVRESFTLSGWAKASALPVRDRGDDENPKFRLRAWIQYYDGGSGEYEEEEYYADFSPSTDEWQYASVQFAKSKHRTVKQFRVYCEYDYNEGKAYFDGLSLVRNGIETGLSSEDFKADDKEEKNVPADMQSDSAAVEPTSGITEFEEKFDAYGNQVTETTFKNGCYGTIYRSYGYNNCSDGMSNSGNDKIRETDARGNDTLYTVDPESSRMTSVTDRCGTRTTYEYDSMGHNTRISVYNSTGVKHSHLGYEYDAFDNVRAITRSDGMKYVMSYNEFHKLVSIEIDGKVSKLANYEYKQGNGRLKQVSYANGDVMKLSYNRLGQVSREKWYGQGETLIADYRYVYDGQGNIVRTIDVIHRIEYNYMYEQGHMVRHTESTVTFNSDGMVVKRTLQNSIRYIYNKDGKLVKKIISSEDAGIADTVIGYETDEESEKYIETTVGSVRYGTHSKSDEFGRKNFDEIQTGVGFISRQYSYHKGVVTSEHRANEKLKSGPVTELVSQIQMSNGRVLSYEYDNEERITSVTESSVSEPGVIINRTEYTYDAMGQLLTETCNGVTVNQMTYDSAGNITSKNNISYTYGDVVWKDKLTGYGNDTITYDSQGNPVSYLGHTLTWEKGRQLKSYDTYSYSYNASGIRTSKTIGGVKHSYRLEGNKILTEKWGSNLLTPLYNGEEEVIGIIYNGSAYYFEKNLQGDVIAIRDSRDEAVAEYSYDAWGVCTIVSDTTEENIAQINPYRYRSYYYDAETGLYYLQSRYYNPVVGRFVNEDDAEVLKLADNTLDTNIYAYCCNDPVGRSDETGNISIGKYINISWKGIVFLFTREVSVVIGAMVLIYRMYSIVSDIRNIYKLVEKNILSTIIATAIPYATFQLSGEIVSWACKVGSVTAIISVILSLLSLCLAGPLKNLIKVILGLFLSYCLPSIVDAIKMLYYGIKKKKGCRYSFTILSGASISIC